LHEELELSTGLIPVKPTTMGFTEHKDLSQFFCLNFFFPVLPIGYHEKMKKNWWVFQNALQTAEEQLH
jgi:hypothetical protein